MDIIEMSIENMAKASNLLYVTAGASALTAGILFFKWDIPKCVQIIAGRCTARKEKQQKVMKKLRHFDTEKLDRSSDGNLDI